MTSSNLKIPVSADVSGVLDAMQQVQEKAKQVNDTMQSGQVGIDIKEAKKDLADLEASAKALTEGLEKVKQSGADIPLEQLDQMTDALKEAAEVAANLEKVLNAVGQGSGLSGTVDGAAKTVEHLKRAKKAHEALTGEGRKFSREQVEGAKKAFDQWRKSGARGTTKIKNQEFDDWVTGGWRSHSIDQTEAKRNREHILRSVGLDAGTPDAAGKGGGSRANRMGAAAGALGGVASSVLNGGDGLFGAAGGAAGAGAGALAGMAFGGPAGAMVGMVAGQLLGGIGRKLDEGVQRAGEEAIEYHELNQALGATKFQFDDLRSSVRHFTDGLGLAYNESAKLARQFASTSAGDTGGIGRDVGTSVGFGRGYGVGPGSAVEFFAQMRHYGQTSNDRDNRKLALQIAEAVQRGGTTAKMDEVMTSISGFVQNASRSSFTEANAGAFASMLATMTGMGLVGMKGSPNTAAAAIGAADAALRKGGGFGEASQTFTMAMLQSKLDGFTAFDMDAVNAQGAMGSISKAFGRDSPAYKLAEQRGDKSLMAKYDEWARVGGDKTMLSQQIDHLEKIFGGETRGFNEAMANHLGMSQQQASVIYLAHKQDGGLGSLNTALKGANIDLNTLDPKNYAKLAGLYGGDRKTLEEQGSRLLKIQGTDALKSEDSARLTKAMADDGNTENLRKIVMQLTATNDREKDEGERTRDVQTKMANDIQKLATELLPLTLAIKEGVIEVVRWVSSLPFSGNDRTKKWLADADREASERLEAGSLDGQIEQALKQVREAKPADKEEQAKIAQSIDELEALKAKTLKADPKADVKAWDHNIDLLKKRQRELGDGGLSDRVAEANALIDKRNAIKSQPGTYTRLSVGKDGTLMGGVRSDADSTSRVPDVVPPSDAPGKQAEKPAPDGKKPKIDRQLSKEELAYLEETDRLLGAPKGTSAAQIWVESRNNPDAVSPAGARGLAQLMPDTQRVVEKRLGRKLTTNMDQLAAHRNLMQENLRKFGNLPDALRAYNGGWEPKKWGNKETSAYVGKIDHARDVLRVVEAPAKDKAAPARPATSEKLVQVAEVTSPAPKTKPEAPVVDIPGPKVKPQAPARNPAEPKAQAKADPVAEVQAPKVALKGGIPPAIDIPAPKVALKGDTPAAFDIPAPKVALKEAVDPVISIPAPKLALNGKVESVVDIPAPKITTKSVPQPSALTDDDGVFLPKSRQPKPAAKPEDSALDRLALIPRVPPIQADVVPSKKADAPAPTIPTANTRNNPIEVVATPITPPSATLEKLPLLDNPEKAATRSEKVERIVREVLQPSEAPTGINPRPEVIGLNEKMPTQGKDSLESKIPAALRPAPPDAPPPVKVSVSGEMVVVDQNGQRTGQTVPLTESIQYARPFGGYNTAFA